MSAILCRKRSYFENLPITQVTKKIRASSTSPVRFSPPRLTTANFSSATRPLLIDQLIVIFPEMDRQVVEKALEECGDDIDLAIKSLYELRLGSADANFCANDGLAPKGNGSLQSQGVTSNGEVGSAEDRSAPNNLPINGGDWVDLFVNEMTSASNMDDARARASRALEVLEKSIIARNGVDAAQNLSKENMMLKEQIEVLVQENTILKRAVSIQYERQREFEGKNQEVQNLKQMVSQYQERLRTLEIHNYALTMHLKQAQQSSSIPGRFHPDVF